MTGDLAINMWSNLFALYFNKQTVEEFKRESPYELVKKRQVFIRGWIGYFRAADMKRTIMYLTAIIDWFSRKIMGWTLSDTLDTAPVLDTVKEAVGRYGVPAIVNSDQVCQFTSGEYKNLLRQYGIRQSMDGKSRWTDNVMIERWFRSLKTELIYINDYASPKELRGAIRDYIGQYNLIRPHQSLGYLTPDQVYGSSFGVSA